VVTSVREGKQVRLRWHPRPDPDYGRKIFNALRVLMALGCALAVMAPDAQRSARLVFAEELRAGRVHEADLDRPEVAGAVGPRPIPNAAIRHLQRLAMKRGDFDFETRNLAPLAAARNAVLGARAAGPPRFYVRVDEYPLAGAYVESDRRADDFARFHEILTDARVPYLLAVSPGVARDYLDPSGTGSRPLSDRELATLDRLRGDGVAFALHGFDHRTRDVRSRHRSELVGVDAAGLADLLDHGTERLAAAGIHPRVFAPPFNRFEAGQYPLLARRYDVVCGGPESVPLFGFHRTPLWLGEAIYMPAYPPFYGRAFEIAAAVERCIGAQVALPVPIVLHWSWESGDWSDLQRLVRLLTGYARPWDELLSA
jgi:hypothetical protein